MSERCPVCGTIGRVWNKTPEVFQCPNCETIYSEFGFVTEPEYDMNNIWN